MELGERLKQARLEAGLSQRQLCGEVITRNMLSQIENGSASPSMDTLRYLAGQLNRPVSYFLEEMAVTSVNQEVMARARGGYLLKDYGAVLKALEEYRTPDDIFDQEKLLLEALACMSLAEDCLHRGRRLYGIRLLNRAEEAARQGAYCGEAFRRQIALLRGRLEPEKLREAVEKLPGLDKELLLRAEAALERGDGNRSGALLDAAENRETPQWNYLRGESYFAQGEYRRAAECYHRVEEELPEKVVPRLEACYRELEDYKRAYEYACRQK